MASSAPKLQASALKLQQDSPVAPIRPGHLSPKRLVANLPADRLIELTGTARVSTAVSMAIRAQAQGEPVAWVEYQDGDLYPPDLADAGIDLDALVVIRIPAARRGRRPRSGKKLARAAELLLRSGAFGLVIVDLGSAFAAHAQPRRWEAVTSRLSALARSHSSQIVLLSQSGSNAASLGPTVGIQIETRQERRGPGRFVLAHHVLKDKSGALRSKLDGITLHTEPCRSPWGLF